MEQDVGLVDMDNRKLIARGRAVAQLLEFLWEDSLRTMWCITRSLSRGCEPDIDALAWMWSASLIVEERICVCKVKAKKKKIPPETLAIINVET